MFFNLGIFAPMRYMSRNVELGWNWQWTWLELALDLAGELQISIAQVV